MLDLVACKLDVCSFDFVGVVLAVRVVCVICEGCVYGGHGLGGCSAFGCLIAFVFGVLLWSGMCLRCLACCLWLA